MPAAVAGKALLGAQDVPEKCLICSHRVFGLRRQDVHLGPSEVQARIVVRVVLRQVGLCFSWQLALEHGRLVSVHHHDIHVPATQDAPPLIRLDRMRPAAHEGLAILFQQLELAKRRGQISLREDLVVVQETVINSVHARPEESRKDHVNLGFDPLTTVRLVGCIWRAEIVLHVKRHRSIDPHGNLLHPALDHCQEPAVLHVAGVPQLVYLGTFQL
mmetsp:Transcript_80535/g.222788  ORF Transcript_80535/g.222788 Transcript_80535/m.222788 type:complete len:216 (-) Transcript_80535:163-810(-)